MRIGSVWAHQGHNSGAEAVVVHKLVVWPRTRSLTLPCASTSYSRPFSFPIWLGLSCQRVGRSHATSEMRGRARRTKPLGPALNRRRARAWWRAPAGRRTSTR
jgi:hypothetical protein